MVMCATVISLSVSCHSMNGQGALMIVGITRTHQMSLSSHTIRFLRMAVLLAILSLSCTAFGQGGEPDYGKVSAILFPETAHWTRLDETKRAEAPFIKNAEVELTKAFKSSRIKDSGDLGCSFIDRLFNSNPPSCSEFFLHDMDRDGREDVIYSGPAQCAEGNATIVWYGTGEGYSVRQDYLWMFKLIRFREGTPFKFTRVSVGCCADPVDVYTGTEPTDTRNITKNTQLPEKSIPVTAFECKEKELWLRSAPARLDAYDEGKSGFMGIAVFGNILVKYLPGSHGRILGQSKAKDGRAWYFVAIDRDCNLLRTLVSYSVDIGWVESDGIETGAADSQKVDPKKQ